MLLPTEPTSAPPEAADRGPPLDAEPDNAVGNLAYAPTDTQASNNISDAAQRDGVDGTAHRTQHIASDADYKLLIRPSRKNGLFHGRNERRATARLLGDYPATSLAPDAGRWGTNPPLPWD